MTKVIGIAGGSCSGKTTLARKIQNYLGDDRCQTLFQDSFYIDQSSRFDYDGGSVNFDHPDAIDFVLMAETIKKLKNNEAAEIPVYDFATHKRKPEPEFFAPKEILLVDGTLILAQEPLRLLFDHSCFIECDHESRLSRRLKRDVEERGRSQVGVLEQFSGQVEPMHQAFVEPSKSNAQVIFSQENLQQPDFFNNLIAEWWI